MPIIGTVFLILASLCLIITAIILRFSKNLWNKLLDTKIKLFNKEMSLINTILLLSLIFYWLGIAIYFIDFLK